MVTEDAGISEHSPVCPPMIADNRTLAEHDHPGSAITHESYADMLMASLGGLSYMGVHTILSRIGPVKPPFDPDMTRQTRPAQPRCHVGIVMR